MNAFIVVCILLRSTYTRFRSSKISSTIKYLREKFLFNRAEICLYASSSSLMLTYVIVIRSIEYQSTFAFNLFCIVDNQCSNFALSSIKIVEFEMTTDRFVFSNRLNALVFVVISWSAVDDLNDDVMNFRTLRVRFWIVSRIFNFSLRARMIYLLFRLSFFRIAILFCRIFRSLWSSSIKSHCSLYSLFIFLTSFLICWIIFSTRSESFVIQKIKSFRISIKIESFCCESFVMSMMLNMKLRRFARTFDSMTFSMIDCETAIRSDCISRDMMNAEFFDFLFWEWKYDFRRRRRFRIWNSIRWVILYRTQNNIIRKNFFDNVKHIKIQLFI
jgi:hypothetical protein